MEFVRATAAGGQGGLNLILLLGIAIFCGVSIGKFFERYHIPKIIGFVSMGIILGPLLGIISPESVRELEPFNRFALGLIGFLIGGELKKEVFIKLGKKVFTILLFEGLTAFLLVGLLSFGVMIFFKDWQTSIAVATVFAAICAATDPASTVSVLWEFKTRGPLTTMLTALVALDDALALVLYAIGVSVAGVITGHQGQGFWFSMGVSMYEIFGSLLLGVAAGFIMNWILKSVNDKDKILVFNVSMALLVIGIAIKFHMDVILAAMAFGLTLINIDTRRSGSSFELMHQFSAPVYIMFFILVGARLQIKDINMFIILLVSAYVIGSIVGKTLGSYIGGKYSKSVSTVTKYMGFCLYPQGGIAVGLLIMASQKFSPEISSLMLLVVIIGAFVLQIIGPFGVKFGASKAGEIGLNITEEDLMKTYKVKDVVNVNIPAISAGMPLREIIELVGRTENYYYSVVDSDGKLIGSITLDGIRRTLNTQELHDWLVALDIMEEIPASISPDVDLPDALEKMARLDIKYMPVIDTKGEKFIGVLNTDAVHRKLAAEVIAKQQMADSMYGPKMAGM